MKLPIVWKWIALTLCASLSTNVHRAVEAKTVQSAQPALTGNVYNSASNGVLRGPIEPAFEYAGKSVGLQVWRIENFKPVACPKNDYGKFYTGDSYIILQTREHNGGLTWDIHFWLGRETSSDEAGSAAILTVMLDNQLGGLPVQHREVQELESPLFLSYFKSGLKYLTGGVSSGFRHVDPSAIKKRLFHVKGKTNVRVAQVDLSFAAMNKGDCFILDAVNNIYVYVGPNSKRTERLKAITAANLIRDQDHGGRSKILIFDEFSVEDEVQVFFNVLGNGSAKNVPDATTEEDDEQFERRQAKAVTLYRVTGNSGKLQTTQISQHPLQQRMLESNGCYILDTSYTNVYVWIGRNSNKKEQEEAIKKAQEFLKVKKYPNWSQVVRIIENGESSDFIQYFQEWKSAGELHRRLIRSTGPN